MPDNTSTLEPQTVDAKGNPPANRIRTADGAWKSWQDALQWNSRNDNRFADIASISDGFSPIRQDELDSEGLSDAPNINLRQFGGKVGTYVSTYVDINTNAEKRVDLQLRRENFPSTEAWKTASEYVAHCFNENIDYWDDDEEPNPNQFFFQRVACDSQMGHFGIGVMRFPDAIDWRPKSIPSRKVIPSPGTHVTLDNCQCLFIGPLGYSVSQLYNFVKDEAAAKRSRWDREAVLDLLYNDTKQRVGGANSSYETYGEWENRVHTNDSFLIFDFRLLDLVHMYVQEFNTSSQGEGISQYVFSKWGTNTGRFLYEYDRQFKRWTQIVVPFCDRPGRELDWFGVKGFGDEIFDACHFNNVFFSATALGAWMQMLPLFQASSESDREKLSQIIFRRMGILFPDVQLAQMKLNVDINGALAVQAESNRVMNANTRIFPQNDQAGMQEKTATQSVFDQQDKTSFNSLQVKSYRLPADRLFTEMYRRMSAPASKYPASWPGGKTAARFRKKMDDYGLSEKQYRETEFVRATRSGGSGNIANDAYKAKEIIAVATPGVGQLNARKEYVATMSSWERVPEFIQDVNVPIPQDQLIGLENATLQDGQFVQAYGWDQHERHLGEPSPEGNGHLAILATAVGSAKQLDQQGLETALEDAIKLHKVMEVTLAHCELHIQFLSTLPIMKDVVKELQKLINPVRGFIVNFGKSIERAMQDRAQQQPQMSAEDMETAAKIQRDNAIAQAGIERENAKQANRLNNMNQTAQSRTALKEQQAQVDMGLKTEQALVDMERQRVENAQASSHKALMTAQELSAADAKTEVELAKTRAQNAAEQAAPNGK